MISYPSVTIAFNIKRRKHFSAPEGGERRLYYYKYSYLQLVTPDSSLSNKDDGEKGSCIHHG